MSASPSSSDTIASGPGRLAAWVGLPCAVTRVGNAYDGHGTLSAPGLRGCWLRCPEIGKPLWLMTGTSNWIRTSPVVAIDASTANQVVVRTEQARYRFVFDAK